MTTAVLVMSYGTPRHHREIATFYTDIRRGRPPSDEELAELVARYDAIGGLSPLTERSNAQIAALTEALDTQAPREFSIYYGTKHARPSIDDAIGSIARDGIDAVIGLVFAPHYSRASIGEYVEKVASAAARASIQATFIDHWHDMPALIDTLGQRVEKAWSAVSLTGKTEVLFSAHSLPERAVASDDPYMAQLEYSARAIAAQANVEHFRRCWQSAGKAGGPWLGPDINDVIEELSYAGVRNVIVCPQGFTSDHLEILYDLDIVAQTTATSFGLSFTRTPSLNDDRRIADGLAELVIAKAAHMSASR